MSAFEREADIGSVPLECADVVRDPSMVCECEGGDGPNCDACVSNLATELAACIDDADDTRALAEACVRAMYAVPRRHKDEVAAAEALRVQLSRLWRRVVGVGVKL